MDRTFYSDVWKWYKESDQYKDQIMEWMDLDRLLPVLGWKDQVEVLENAPLEVIEAHAELLDERAKKKLGLTETFAWAKLV